MDPPGLIAKIVLLAGAICIFSIFPPFQRYTGDIVDLTLYHDCAAVCLTGTWFSFTIRRATGNSEELKLNPDIPAYACASVASSRQYTCVPYLV